MKLLSQRDPKWSFKPIGQSKRTIGSDGCVITDISMLSDWYGLFKDPSWMAKNLKFTDGGLLLWNSVSDSILPFKFTWRFYNNDESRIIPALSGKKTACLLQLRGIHWVVGIKKIGSYYYVADPYPLPSGKRSWVHKSLVSGGATFDIK